jgi:molecular chaperone GrpE
MDRVVRIPVRIQASPDVLDSREQAPENAGPELGDGLRIEARTLEPGAQSNGEAAAEARDAQETDWRDRALRLQAEMDNFRKRQQRLAQDQIQDERRRLLTAFLGTVDNLERALRSSDNSQTLRQGVQLTHREALQFLGREGVEEVQVLGRPFDPAWHEAVATVGRGQASAAPETVVQVLQPGYRLNDQLLRPARVIVAV